MNYFKTEENHENLKYLSGGVYEDNWIPTRGYNTVAFSPYGIADIIGVDPSKYDNITNYGSKKDPVYIHKIDNQVGKTYILDVDPKDYDPSVRPMLAEGTGLTPPAFADDVVSGTTK